MTRRFQLVLHCEIPDDAPDPAGEVCADFASLASERFRRIDGTVKTWSLQGEPPENKLLQHRDTRVLNDPRHA